MAPPSIGVTGSGSRLPAPDLPTPVKAISARLSGYAAYYQSRPPSLTSDGSLLAAARKREEEARLAAERARAMADQQRQLPSILDAVHGPFARTPGPWAPGQAPSEIEQAKQDAINTPMSRPVDTPGFRPGVERPGYLQEKVFEGSKHVGWKYVVDPDAANAGWSAADAYNNNWMERNKSVDPASVSDVSTRHYTNEQMVAEDQRGYEGTDDWRDLGPYVRQMAEEVYGPAKEKTNAWGETYWEFPTDKKYLGIPDEWAQRGWMPATTPKAPGPNASFEEQMAYRQKLRQSVVAPRYREGDNVAFMRQLSPKDAWNLQRQLKKAGLLDPDTPIFKGKYNAEQYQLVSELMMEANVTGLTLDQVIAGHIQTHQANVAASRGGGGGGGGGDMTRQVQITYDTTSLAQGRAMLARVLADALGRAPSDSELQQYMARLNGAEAKSPTRTITNYVRSGSTTTSTSRTKPSDVDPEAMAREFATEINGGEEFYDMQANGYLDRLMQRLIGAANG